MPLVQRTSWVLICQWRAATAWKEALLTDEVYRVLATVPCEPRFTSHRDPTRHLWSKRQTRIVMIARITDFFGYKMKTFQGRR